MLALLILGFVKIAILLVGLYASLRLHKHAASAAFSIALINATVFAFRNANYHVAPNLITLATIVSTPGVALLVGAFLLEYRRWR